MVHAAYSLGKPVIGMDAGIHQPLLIKKHISNKRQNNTYRWVQYELTPNMAIIDPDLVIDMRPKLTAYAALIPLFTR